MDGKARPGRLWAAILLLVLLVILFGCPATVLAGLIRSPHTVEACLDCHRNQALQGGNPEGVPVIIIPEGEDPHRVLLNTCIQCHPKGVPPYWLVSFPKRGAPGAVAAPSAPQPSAPKIQLGHPHDEMDCSDCHKNPVAFGKKTGGEKEMVKSTGDLSDLCTGCHDEIAEQHFPRGNVPRAGASCVSCHKPHGVSKIPPSLRDDYYNFIRETKDFNPHGGTAFCLSCHPSRPVAGEPAEYLFGNKELNRLCVRCHVLRDHHVIDKPPSKSSWKMEFLNYPLQEGKLACITCHLPHGGEGRARAGSYSLRGEPYSKMTDFCMKCHEEKSWGKLNAHDHLTPDGEVLGWYCLFCHTKVPDVSVSLAEAPGDFNDSYNAVCVQCHEQFPHPEVNHYVIPSTATLDTMRKYEQKRSVNLPLDFDGRLTCVTCHNPHEKGLLTGPDSVGADEKQRLRLTTYNEICTPCHGRH